MQPAGRAVIDAARADGSWTLLDDVEDLIVPPDLAEAFDRHPGSRAQWDGFGKLPRKAMLDVARHGQASRDPGRPRREGGGRGGRGSLRRRVTARERSPVSDGLPISGALTWVLATVIVWVATLVAGMVLRALFVKKAVT